jgi:proteasome lid subunit RPN8/RPN11
LAVKAFDVHVSDKAQRAFRRRAIRHFRNNKEYCEGMKLRRSVGEFHIEAYVPLPIDQADDSGVTLNDAAFQEFKKQCTDEGFDYGSIHTHITCDTAPSTPDLVESLKEGEALIGIMEIETRKKRVWSKIDYWIPQMPCEVNIIKE